MKFEHRKNPILKNQHIIQCENIMLHLHEADFDSDEEMNQAIQFILTKLNA
jgi:hypothetical protein